MADVDADYEDVGSDFVAEPEQVASYIATQTENTRKIVVYKSHVYPLLRIS